MRTSIQGTVVCLLTLFLHYESVKGEEAIGDYVCLPQEGLPLTETKSPAKQQGMTFCQQWSSCTCCSPKHAAAMQYIAESVYESQGVSRSCIAYSSMMTCRVCDPSVGIGLKKTVCGGTCNEWFKACKDDFFAFKGIKQELQLCDERDVVCSPLHMLAEDGADLCSKAGHRIAPKGSQTCFDGKMKGSTQYCNSSSTSSSSSKSKDKDKPKAPTNTVLTLVLGYLMLFTVILVWVLFCGMDSRAWISDFTKMFKGRPAPKAQRDSQ
mmetsp:Transcript_4123/g.4721  ORF Transcript_4123/g.4721 Transcript_4123/m.4721 type:complete len:266 (-) Transcript_4123:323-1120(-)